MTDHTTNTALRLRPPAHRVSRRAIGYWTATAAILWIVLLGLQTVIVVTSDDPPSFLSVTLVVSCVLAPLHLVVMPQWRYRVHRWEVTAEAVYTQAGWLKQEWRIAPVSRIQTVDIERDPFEQLFGLAKITVTTASAAGPLRISGLAHGRALELADELTKTTQAMRGDAT
ncbi:membrane protein YdbS with pleckstrin-like domain [Amycolatopsis lexingtonensis]|uniref:Membrane protein YdbS with pleckstrin-like domain n=1 Tax=Amycolatopsis lexingtonensis TaxID=218822 RepID=A0ABR9IDL1_9PSEU|nr:PH domain-containing protein [Amycolatopsis lexingtonensis]MBE1501266.1 membrane protein YdbS with pleckstrin-like domain [Amycolatopsis lexingtonensis]